jgi:hypothetical protein
MVAGRPLLLVSRLAPQPSSPPISSQMMKFMFPPHCQRSDANSMRGSKLRLYAAAPCARVRTGVTSLLSSLCVVMHRLGTTREIASYRLSCLAAQQGMGVMDWAESSASCS